MTVTVTGQLCHVGLPCDSVAMQNMHRFPAWSCLTAPAALDPRQGPLRPCRRPHCHDPYVSCMPGAYTTITATHCADDEPHIIHVLLAAQLHRGFMPTVDCWPARHRRPGPRLHPGPCSLCFKVLRAQYAGFLPYRSMPIHRRLPRFKLVLSGW